MAIAADEFETELGFSSLNYYELGRVFVNENVVTAKHEIRDDEYISLKAISDAMTGVSPSGAAQITGSVQTITSPSGKVTEVSGASTPVFEFSDLRGALGLGWIKPLKKRRTLNIEAISSTEKDYSSVGLSATLSAELNKRMTTVSVGFGGSIDEVEPEGGVPEGLTPIDNLQRREEETKVVSDGIIGITQVLDKSSLLQVNYSIGYSLGYLNDPYKIVSYIESLNDEPRTGDGYYFEQRPSSRLRQAIFLKYLKGEKKNSYDVSYRFFFDDWGVSSHTLDFHYEEDKKAGATLRWHGRLYMQTAADFYHYYIYDGPSSFVDDRDIVPDITTLEYVSGDYRLGNLNTYTFGAKYSLPSKYGVFAARGELMLQHDRKGLFAPVVAFISQLTWRLKFF